jgi:hypothetical protein
MEQVETFKARWGRLLKLTMGLCVLILVGIAIIGVFTGPRGSVAWIVSMTVMPLLSLTVAMFFLIRGYVLTQDRLIVQRLGWSSTLDLSDLKSAEADSNAMARSIRTFGNGGLFCFAGYFQNKKLGPYRASATDPKKSVVLTFANRVIVVTPEHPEEFVAAIKNVRKL